MARTVSVLPNVWTELTSADATDVTVSNTSGLPVYLRATAGPAPVGDDDHGFLLLRGASLFSVKLTALSPGQNNPVRLWARSGGAADVWIDHKHEVA